MQKRVVTVAFNPDENLYFNVVAELKLRPSNEKHEHYRFLYFEQLVLAELFRQSTIEQHVNLQYSFGVEVVGAVGVVLTLFLVVSFVTVKWLAPAVGRMVNQRNRVLVDEANEYHREEQTDAVPSSDRKQITPTD
jgi:hypothetical protein